MTSAVPKRERLGSGEAAQRFGVRVKTASGCEAPVAGGLLASALASLVLFGPADVAAEDCQSFPDKRDCPQPAAPETPRGLALGTGMRASAVSTSALAYSPAALSLGNLYHIEANLDYMAELDTVALGAGAVDSSTSKVGAGIALRGFLSGDDGFNTDTRYDYDGLDGRLGVGLALSDAFALGVGARYVDISTEADADGDGEIDEDEELVQGFTMDASLRIVPVSSLQIDIAAQNFIDLDSSFAPVMVNAGLALAVASALSLGMDVLTDMSSFDNPEITIGGGIEYLGGNSVPVRAGYSFDIAREIHTIGAGIGYTDQRIGLDIGLRQEVAGGNATRVMGAVRYYVN
jgi:hypothetical protein